MRRIAGWAQRSRCLRSSEQQPARRHAGPQPESRQGRNYWNGEGAGDLSQRRPRCAGERVARPAGWDIQRAHENSRGEHLVLHARHRESRAPHADCLGLQNLRNSSTDLKVAAQFQACDRYRRRRRPARTGDVFLHAATWRGQNRRRTTVAHPAGTLSLDWIARFAEWNDMALSSNRRCRSTLAFFAREWGLAGAMRSRHRHAELRSFLFQPRIEFLDHLRRPLFINLSGRVLSFPQHHVTPFVDQVIHLCFVGELFGQLRWNERYPLGIPNRNVAGHHRHIPNPNGDVDSGKHHVLEGRGIDAARVDLETRHLLDSSDVANCTIHDQAVMALGIDRGREIVANDGSIADFSEKVDDQNIAGFENVDNPGVFVANPTLLFAIGLNHRVHIRTTRHKHGRYNAADQSWSRIDHFPAAFKLIAILG